MKYVLWLVMVFALAAGLFLILQAWYSILLRLSSKYDLQKRRKYAALLYPVVALISCGLILASIFVFDLVYPEKGVLRLGFGLALIPCILWWIRKVPDLEKLGYGRRRRE